MRLNELTQIFKDCQRQLYVAALSITKNRESAEDAVHDALLAVASISTRPSDLKAYLFTTVRNKALHQLKYAQRSTNLVEDYLESQDCNEEQNIFVAQVKQKIALLNLNEQQTLIMKLFEDLTLNEIAIIMDTSTNTVASWYRRGLDKLKEALDEKL